MTILIALDSISSTTDQEATQYFGGKAAGLLHVPSKWRPETLLISTELYENWVKNRDEFSSWATARLKGEIHAAIAFIGHQAILRSSATDETIRERGQFLSVPVTLGLDCSELVEKVCNIFSNYFPHDGRMCLILQRLIVTEERGFLSNELRLVDKPYRWIAERHFKRRGQELVDARPISAKQAKPFAPHEPLVCVSSGELLYRV